MNLSIILIEKYKKGKCSDASIMYVEMLSKLYRPSIMFTTNWNPLNIFVENRKENGKGTLYDC